MIPALVTASKFLVLLSSFATIGALLALAFLILDKDGKLSTSGKKIRSIISISASLWFLSSFLNILFTLANILGGPVSSVLDLTVIQSFVFQISLGQYLFFQMAIAFLITLTSRAITSTGYTAILLLIALIAVAAPVFQSHSASSGSHALAIGSLFIHVIALSFWVGGVIAIALLNKDDRKVSLPRFSHIALWAAIAVVLSGVLNASVRLNFAAAWTTSYAYVVILKVAVTFVLLFIGYKHRNYLAAKPSVNWSAMTRLISVEAGIMTFVTLLGSWLSSNQPPVRGGAQEFNAALAITGLNMPEAPTFSRILFEYNPDVLMIGLLVLAVALYIKGVVVLTRRGDKWPVGRTISFALGISAIDFATSGGLGVYSYFAFSWHMVAHMVLGMIAPIGIVLGAPITLALRTLPQSRDGVERGVRGLLISALHSRYSRVITNPIVALAIFDGSLFVLYFTPLFGGMMQSHLGHLLMGVHFLLAGILFFHVIVGIDPNPRKVPHLVRIGILLAAMSIHAFFSVALMSTTTLIDGGYFESLQRPWSTDLLADQKSGGAIGWAMGEIPILIALIATFIQWMRDDSNEAKRIDRNTARMAALGQPDELAQYNMYLNNLDKRDREANQ
jgi:cytochrome c oxidase assembly factor CtaG/putative copper export protein|uniref:cytochrome c oxidase assembly protein n=1 Tax=Candidatus Planktophila sp. TaxID=2175601 RepID=UPI00404915BC